MATNNLSVKKGQCINFGNCSKANAREVIEVNLGDDFICPECEGGLIEKPPKDSFPPALKKILIIAGILVVLGAVAFWGYPFVKGLINKDIKNEDIKPKTEEAAPIATPAVIPDSIALNKTSLEFKNAGESEQLTVTVFPANMPEKDKGITWKSGDEKVATVDANGVVTAVANGNTIIYSSTAGNRLTTTCYVSVGNLNTAEEAKPVEEQPQKVESVKQSVILPVIPPVIPPVKQNEKQNEKKNEKQNEKQLQRGNSKTYSFGKYSGTLKNGIPEGEGTMFYTRHTQIATHASNTYYAEDGDVFVGTWGNGDIVNGKLYDKNNNLKATILAGRRPNPHYIEKD